MEDISLLLNKIVRKDYYSDDLIWDEWFFYEDAKSVLDIYSYFYEVIKKTTHKFDYVCSLGKSGFPLASKLAFDVRKPLLISSMSEFIYEDRTFILGLPPESSNIEIENKLLLAVDSHTHTGGTIRLADNLIKTRNIKDIEYAVIYNCIDSEEKKLENKSIHALYAWENIREALTHIVGKKRIKENDFWMKEDKYWLTYVSTEAWKTDVLSDSEASAKALLSDEDGHHFIKSGYITPLNLYLNPSLFHKLIENTLKELEDQDIDTFVALSVSSIPLAFILALEQQKRKSDKNIKFYFLMNEPDEYYRAKLNASQGILICDDIMISGGLLYAATKLLLEKSNSHKLKVILTLFDCKQFPSRGRRYLNSVIASTRAKYLAGLSF
jgi:adenine/guanine phosphoribosyltransferase-like PRPP-binding protein